jgi:tetrahydromethanopterin S-methyltransferase subunit G
MAKPEKSEKQTEKQPEEKREDEKVLQHVEGIKKTITASLFGIAGGIVSYYLNILSYGIIVGILILAVLIYLQRQALPPMGINVKEFRFSDWFYLGFMTFAFWFVSWTILLNK